MDFDALMAQARANEEQGKKVNFFYLNPILVNPILVNPILVNLYSSAMWCGVLFVIRL